jgi:hypothetical protein
MISFSGKITLAESCLTENVTSRSFFEDKKKKEMFNINFIFFALKIENIILPDLLLAGKLDWTVNKKKKLAYVKLYSQIN